MDRCAHHLGRQGDERLGADVRRDDLTRRVKVCATSLDGVVLQQVDTVVLRSRIRVALAAAFTELPTRYRPQLARSAAAAQDAAVALHLQPSEGMARWWGGGQ